MPTTQEDIRGWLKWAKDKGATHLIVACDTFDWEDYPVEVMPDEDVHAKYAKYNGPNMQKVMEVYNLSMDLEAQIRQGRSFNF